MIGEAKKRSEQQKMVMLTSRLSREARQKIQQQMGVQGEKEQKYHAEPVVREGVRYASVKEYDRYRELFMKQKAGLIRGLKRQVTFRFVHNGVPCGKYVADATYYEPGPIPRKAWDLVVEDSKGVRTPLYQRSKKMMLAFYGIEIRET